MKKTIEYYLNQNIRILKQKSNISEIGEIIGINYLIATIQIMKEMKGSTIFSNEDEDNPDELDEGSEEDYERGYEGSIGLSKKFLLKRIKKLNLLLNDFNKPKEPLSNSEIMLKRKEELEYLLMEFKMDGKIDWLNRNGLYSFYKSVEEGFVTYGELGSKVEKMIKLESKLINSK